MPNSTSKPNKTEIIKKKWSRHPYQPMRACAVSHRVCGLWARPCSWRGWHPEAWAARRWSGRSPTRRACWTSGCPCTRWCRLSSALTTCPRWSTRWWWTWRAVAAPPSWRARRPAPAPRRWTRRSPSTPCCSVLGLWGATGCVKTHETIQQTHKHDWHALICGAKTV